MSKRTHLLARGCGIVAALTLLGTGARAQFADYTRRVPVTIKNNGVSATPTPTSAEVVFPMDANMRADQLDIRVGFNNGTGIQEIDSKIFRASVSEVPANRVVFRLQQPIPAGGQSAGQYYVYYGNPSPSLTAKRDLKKVFDHVVDFLSEANVVGQPAPDWDVQLGNTMTVEQYQGRKVGVMRWAVWHPRATVKQTAMPAFLNAEVLTHYAPYGGGASKQIGALARVVANPADPNFQGGYGYGVGWGDDSGLNRFIASFMSPVVPGQNPPGLNPYTSDPVALGPVKPNPPAVESDRFVNSLQRITGDPGLIQGKNWNDGDAEPATWFLEADRANFHPARNFNGTWVEDPIYNQAGTVGIMSYGQITAVDYIAARELRDLSGSSAPVETLTPTGPFIQGTLTSSLASANPVAGAILRITGPGGYDQSFAVGPTGQYRVSLPAGAYAVSASAPFHDPVVVNNVSPSTSSQTNIVLPYVAATIQGSVRDATSNQAFAGITVVAVDANGQWQGSAKTDANGAYQFISNHSGALSIAALSVGLGNDSRASGLSQRHAVQVVPGSTNTVNFRIGPPLNGDFEIPTQDGSGPLGWEPYRFTPRDPSGVFKLDTAQNHTPGGRYSISVTNPTADWEAWIPKSFQWASLNPNTSYTISTWVYFTQPGQRARLRIIPLDSSGAGIDIAQPTGGAYITAGSPDPVSGLQAPINQWTRLETVIPSDPRLAKLDARIYVAGPTQGGLGTGTVYLDDYSVTATPAAVAQGRLVDADGNPVADAYIGQLTADLVTGENTLWQGAYSVTDADGNFNVYPAYPGETTIAAFKLPPAPNYVLPPFGYVVDPATGILNATATPGPRQTMRLVAAGNVAANATGTAVDAKGKDRSVNIARVTDDNLSTRWDSGSMAADDHPLEITFTLPKAEPVDQLEILWELADAHDVTISLNDGSGVFLPLVDQSNAGSLGLPSGSVDYAPGREGATHIFRFPTAQTVRSVRIDGRVSRPGTNNFSLIELRALSIANAPSLPISNADVSKALKIAGGLVAATTADRARLDADGDGNITVLDAAALRRSLP